MRAIICFIVLSVSFQSSSFAVELLKVHGIFKSNMVLQRDKPIMIWGWAPLGTTVTVTFGKESSQAKAMGEKGRWEVIFKAKPANSQGLDLVVKAGDKSIAMKNILMGDIWVMNGQSNMAFSLTGVYQKHFEASMAHLPLMRHIRINSGAESEKVEVDIDDSFINGKSENKDWSVVSPEVAMQMGAIGYIFGLLTRICGWTLVRVVFQADDIEQFP